MTHPPKRKKRSFLKNVLINLIGRFYLLIIVAASEVFIARFYGPEGKGYYSLLLFWSMFIATIAHLGFSRSYIYYSQKKSYKTSVILDQTILYAILSSSIVAFIGWYLMNFLDTQDLTNISAEEFKLLFIAAPALLSIIVVPNIFMANENFKASNATTITYRTSVILIAFVFTYNEFEMVGLLYAIVGGAVFSSITGWLVALKEYRKAIFPVLHTATFKKMFLYGIKAASYNIVILINTRVDHLLIGSILGLTQLGFYSVAVIVSELTGKLARILSEVMFPKSSGLNDKEADQLTNLLLKLVFLASLIFVLITAPISFYLVPKIFGVDFSKSVLPLLILLPGGIFANLNLILVTDLSARGRPGLTTLAAIASSCVIVLGNLLFTPTYGITSAAIIATLANLLTFCVCSYFHIRYSNNSVASMLTISQDDKAIVLHTVQRISHALSKHMP